MSTSPLVKAACDSEVLGATLRLWPKQRELLASLDLPVITHIWAIGRQASKSTLGAIAAVHNCALRPDLDAMLPRGRVRYGLVAAPGEAQAREFVSLAAALVDASDFLRSVASIKADRIDFTLPSGARTAIRAMPANSRSVRGVSASLIVLDEFAHFSDTAGPASDERMFAALEPSTRVFGEAARVLAISTPYGETGRFYELFQAAQSGLLPLARVEHAATWDVDKRLTAAWRERKHIEVGEDVFRQEYGAEFISGAGQFFDLRGIDFDDGPVAPEDGKKWVAGLDPAFHADHFGVALVGESVHEPGLLVVGQVDGIKPGEKRKSLELRRGREDATLAKVWALIEPYAPRIVTDQHQADAVQSYFGRKGCAVQVVHLNGPIQTAAFTSTRTRLVDGSLRLWKHAQLLEELRRVRAKDTESIVLPRFAGSHGDIASAIALATYELRHVSGMPEGKPAGGETMWAAHARAAGGAPGEHLREHKPLSIRDLQQF